MDLQNTQVMHRPLTLTDPATGATVPLPAGDVFTAAASSPSLGVVIALDAAGNQELVMNALVIRSDATNGGGNIQVTVTDSAGDTAADVTGADAINIVPTPVSAVISIGAPTFTTQPAPTAPGP
jgi:hypothetical protein